MWVKEFGCVMAVYAESSPKKICVTTTKIADKDERIWKNILFAKHVVVDGVANIYKYMWVYVDVAMESVYIYIHDKK